MVSIYIYPLMNTPPPTEGVIISQPIFRFLGVIFDGDHDFERLRSPRALHLGTVLRNLLRHLGTPRKPYPHPMIVRWAREDRAPRSTVICICQLLLRAPTVLELETVPLSTTVSPSMLITHLDEDSVHMS